MVDDLRRLADGVRAHDSVLIGQVQDTGRGRHVPGRTYLAMGASALPDDLSYSMPRVMDGDEIARFIADTAQSCQRMQACGFGGIEVSAGHGHLFHQFLSPRSNQRDDAYGGDAPRRLRFLLELCQAIRAVCGSGFIMGVKLPGDDGVPGGISPWRRARSPKVWWPMCSWTTSPIAKVRTTAVWRCTCPTTAIRAKPIWA